MKISPDCVQQIISVSKVEEVIAGFISLSKNGSGLIGKCPKCNADGKIKGKKVGLTVSIAKGLFKCFSCDFSGKSAVDFLMEAQGKTYPEALLYLADKFHVILEYEQQKKGPQRKGGNIEPTFRDRQLQSSGLTNEDQKATVFVDEDTRKIIDVFEPGTRDQYGKITCGDDMIIWYYDLDGRAVMFQKPKSNKIEQLWRIRYQNPDLHRDLNGRPKKYESPFGSGSHLFIPEQVRQIYHDRRVIKRLYIQEGEKKSIKASVHGMLSVGIMGIQNIGYKGKLPYELQLIIRACKVEEVVFVLDSDWDHLNNELKPGSRVDQRPWSFYHAVKNYRDYFKTFINENIYLEIYFAHIRDNEAKEKGIDDLLAGSLNGKAKEFLDDLNEAFNLKEGDGKFIQVHKISTVSDTKLLEYWSLHNAEAFATRYKPFLEDLPEFTIGKHRWKFDDKWKLTPAQPLEDDELFWESQIRTDKKGNEYSQYYFNYRKAYIFLRRRGYGRIEMVSGEDQLCHIDNKVVGILNSYRIRDYMIEFTEAVLEEKDKDAVMNMFFRGGKMYFGPDSLSNMKYVNPVFEVADKNYQYLFFQDMFWKITAEGIEEKPLSDLQNYVWKDKVNDFKATLLKNEMVTVDHIDEAFIRKNNLDPDKYSEFIGQFDVSLSKESDDCHFLKFLGNTGEFFWRKFQDPKTRQPTHDTRSFDEKFETNLHLVSKMTAIGYLLHKYRDKSCEKAVIGMDGKLSEVGDSNGRTGKSIMGMAIGYVIPQIYIGAKSKDLEGDAFIFEEVSEKTDNIFLDDVRANIDFEFFFPIITGRLTVNRKGQQKFTLPDNDTPKMYITTNHAINGNSASFKDRQFLIAFSDYYNEDHKPIYDFGINFFDEWDQQQWNLFYNFMANCMQLYFKAAQKGWGVGQSGLISPPTERLELRRLRQFIGEDFLTWAGEYFNIEENKPINSNSGNNLNRDIPRSELYNDFLEKTPTQRKFITPQRFKKKMTAWCQYMGLKFNPQYTNKEGNPGGDDKRGGTEYFTIANGRFTITRI